MDVDLLYGRQGIRVTLPDAAVPTMIEKPAMPVLTDPAAAVVAALDQPAVGPSLQDLATGKRSACILICDVTRPVPNQLFLRPVIERLLQSGLHKNNIVVLVATGLHRPNVGDELAEVVGDPWVLQNVQVENHDARNDAQHIDLGRTSRDTVVRLDQRLVEAELRIATGLVEPHLMAGYSGGRKVIAPGVAHAETIRTLHNHRFMSDPRATNCVLDGNPLHEELLEIVDLLGAGSGTGAGAALALNTVIDDQRRLAFVNFGEVVASHMAAVEFMRPYAEVAVDRRFKTVLTSSAGYPLDKTYYQTIKGVVGALAILADGGDLIIVSECSEGLGSVEHVAAQRRYLQLGRDGFLAESATRKHAAIDEWQTHKLASPQARVNITMFSDGLGAEERELTGVTMADSAEQAVAESLARHGDLHLAVIPEGPYVVPFCR